jgi:hypothetical protein
MCGIVDIHLHWLLCPKSQRSLHNRLLTAAYHVFRITNGHTFRLSRLLSNSVTKFFSIVVESVYI